MAARSFQKEMPNIRFLRLIGPDTLLADPKNLDVLADAAKWYNAAGKQLRERAELADNMAETLLGLKASAHRLKENHEQQTLVQGLAPRNSSGREVVGWTVARVSEQTGEERYQGKIEVGIGAASEIPQAIDHTRRPSTGGMTSEGTSLMAAGGSYRGGHPVDAHTLANNTYGNPPMIHTNPHQSQSAPLWPPYHHQQQQRHSQYYPNKYEQAPGYMPHRQRSIRYNPETAHQQRHEPPLQHQMDAMYDDRANLEEWIRASRVLYSKWNAATGEF